MAVITLTIGVSEIDTVIQSFDKIQVQRSEAGSPYTDAKFITAASITPPTLVGTTSGPFTLSGLSLNLKVDDGNEQSVVFVSANPISITTVVNTFNNNISGATASDNGSGQLKITGNTSGTGGLLEITGGTGRSVLGFTTGDKDNGEDAHITLQSGTTSYTYSDLSGDEDFYYRTRFYNSSSGLISSFSDWVQGETTPAICDDPQLDWSDEEITGINILLSCLKNRLKNNLEVETKDAYGNVEFVSCTIFTNDELVWFLKCSLSWFNETPHFTDFGFSDEVIYNRYGHVIVDGACIFAWAAQMVIEAGREFTISDNGVTFNPPPLSTVLNNELSQFHSAHREQLKFIKGCIKPSPVGFGSFRVLAANPNYMRLRHLRQRRII